MCIRDRVETLLGDPSNAESKLGWVPEISAQQMCAEMVAKDLEIAQKNSFLRAHGRDATFSIER